MVHGQLQELEGHNCWTMAEAAGPAGPRTTQHLLSRVRVDERRMLGQAAGWAVSRLTENPGEGCPDAVLTVDETGDEKSCG